MKDRSLWLPAFAACFIIASAFGLTTALEDSAEVEVRGMKGGSRGERYTIRKYNNLVDRLLLIINGDLEETADPLPVFIRTSSDDTLHLHFQEGKVGGSPKRARALYDENDDDAYFYDDATYDDLEDQPNNNKRYDVTELLEGENAIHEPNNDGRLFHKKKNEEEAEKEEKKEAKNPEEETELEKMDVSRLKGNKKNSPQKTRGKNNENKGNKKNNFQLPGESNRLSEASGNRQKGKGQNKNGSSNKQGVSGNKKQQPQGDEKKEEETEPNKKQKGKGSRNRQRGGGKRKEGSGNNSRRRPGPQRMKQKKEQKMRRQQPKNAMLIGLSSLKRKDDVEIRNRVRSKLIIAHLAVGPLKLIFNSTSDVNYPLRDAEATVENSEAELRLVERRGKVLLQRVKVTKGTLEGTTIKVNSNNLLQDRSGATSEAVEKNAEQFSLEAVRLLRTGQVKGRLNRLARLALQQVQNEDNK